MDWEWTYELSLFPKIARQFKSIYEESSVLVMKSQYGKVIDLESFMTDGRYTEPADGKTFDIRKMLEEVKRIGRPLTEAEAEKFRIL